MKAFEFAKYLDAQTKLIGHIRAILRMRGGDDGFTDKEILDNIQEDFRRYDAAKGLCQECMER